MKINRGKNVEIDRVLILTRGEEKLILTEGDFIEVTTDETDFSKTYAGMFEFNDSDRIIVGEEDIPIEYIEEIKILE